MRQGCCCKRILGSQVISGNPGILCEPNLKCFLYLWLPNLSDSNCQPFYILRSLNGGSGCFNFHQIDGTGKWSLTDSTLIKVGNSDCLFQLTTVVWFILHHVSNLPGMLVSSTIGLFTSSFSVTSKSKVCLINLGANRVSSQELKKRLHQYLLSIKPAMLFFQKAMLPGLDSRQEAWVSSQSLLCSSFSYFKIRACRKVRQSCSNIMDGHQLVSATQEAVVMCNFFENQHQL